MTTETAIQNREKKKVLPASIVQGVLGSCDGVRLAAAVSRAGGLGTLTLYNPSAEVTRVRLRRLRALTTRPVLLAFTAEWERDCILDLCLEDGRDLYQVFWWNGPRLCRRIQAGGGRVLWQVGTVGQAEEALSHGADGLLVQGTGAGGPVRSPHRLSELVPKIRTMAGEGAPLVAGGGLATAQDVRATLALGADAALLGTRFLLTQEACAGRAHKRQLVRASASDLVLDTQLTGSWPCSPRRRLGRTALGDSPQLFAGEGLSHMHDLPRAAQVVRRLSAGL